MKKHLRKLLAFAFIPLILSSCKNDETNQTNNSSENNQVETNNNENNENNANNGNENTNNGEGENTNNGNENTNNGENENTNNGENNNNDDQPKEVEIGEVYSSLTWDVTVNDMLEQAIGDLSDKVPVFIAPSYEAEVDWYKEEQEEFLIFRIDCIGTNASSAERLYREKMTEKGFTLSSTGPYGYLMKDYESDLFLDYAVITNDVEPYFQIKTYVRKTRQLEWDSYFIDLYADMHVPVCPANAYNNLYNNIQNEVIVYAMFIEDNAMNNYQKILRDAGYTYNANSTSDCVVYDDPTGYVSVQVYETYGDYNTLALYITITNRWPTFSILAYTGLVDFPKMNCDEAIYYGYSFDAGESDEDTVLLVFYDNLSNMDFANYISYLVNEHGFVASNQRTSDEGNLFVDLTLETEICDVYILLGFQYNNTTNNTMFIAFYQCVPQGE